MKEVWLDRTYCTGSVHTSHIISDGMACGGWTTGLQALCYIYKGINQHNYFATKLTAYTLNFTIARERKTSMYSYWSEQ